MNDQHSLTMAGNDARSRGDIDAAIAFYRRARAAAPDSVAAEHNLGVALADRLEFEAAATHLEAAVAKGGTAPETWLALARTLQNGGRLDDAEAAYQSALARNRRNPIAIAESAQLIWMRTGDLERACQPALDALAVAPEDPALWRALAHVRQYGLDLAGAIGAIQRAIQIAPGDPSHRCALSFALLQLNRPHEALTAADEAIARPPQTAYAHVARAQAALALGQPDVAERAAEAAYRLSPADQNVMATLASAWRAQGNPRYEKWCADALLRVETVEAPSGWASLDAYLSDLAAAVGKAHIFGNHPFGNSVRHGSQAPNILAGKDPALRAFEDVIDGPIRRHVALLQTLDDNPATAWTTGRYSMQGAWSVCLRPGGFHASHVHPDGWLSCVFYVSAPDFVGEPPPAGYLQIGQPNFATAPPQPPHHAIKPAPGTLVIFPSYFWHGTAPFRSPGKRLTIAFDLAPA